MRVGGSEGVFAHSGRFGPYIKYGSKFVSLKDDDPYTVTLERALEVVAEKTKLLFADGKA